jgi:cupin 2 domain-containing protein
MHSPHNIYTDLPRNPGSEHFLTFFESASVKVERIVSHAYISPKDYWCDQGHDEWVMVVKGEAVLQFDGGEMVTVKTGDHLLIPRHTRHRVERTSEETVWLAVHVKK